MNEYLEALDRLHEFAWSNDEYRNDIENTDYQILINALNVLQSLLGHITDLYRKKVLDYYADREPYYYDYYIVFDNTPLRVSQGLYKEIKSQLGLEREPDKELDGGVHY